MAKILLWAVGFVLLLEVYSVLGQDYKLVCYYTNWAHKRRDCKFLPEDINPRLCTHLIFAFAVIGNNHQIVAQEKEDEDLYISFNSLKKRNPNLKTLLSIGGWNFGTEKFTAMASSKETRLIFIKSVIDFLRQKDFDGLDLHWEYPAFNRSPYQDKQHFTLLVQETVEEFKKESSESNKPRLLLSAAVASGIRNIQAGYEIEKISEALDFIGVMTYEFHGPWDLKTGPNSPLYRSSTDYNDNKYFNVEFATNYWKQNGAPAEKLLVGFPTYGRTFTLCSADSKPGAAACGPAPPGNCTKAAGIWAYYEICDFLKGANKEWMEEQEVPYAYKDDEWVTYDNLKSYEKKVEWLKNNSFGGAMVWTIDMDDSKATTTALPTPASENSSTSPPSTVCPDLEFCSDKNNGSYPIPCALDSFYRCTNKNTDIENCPKGTSYNTIKDKCVWPNRLFPTINLAAHNFCKGKPDGNYAIPTPKYYKCSADETRIKQCPSDLLYNAISRNCENINMLADFDVTFCSNNLDGTYPIPGRPNKFYHCSNKETNIGSCPKGSVYNNFCKC
ncbi:acidic mammalian chitinase-like isoform X2 [Rhincodon typus]|uniref:acidic mammalian chitinase-like isoform X2 n=1 Tax=Rhincodon typus TaxID=259920 RepID=UPI00202EB988|nr:acidic mammalian chitinase-like isoform X2 [Rhincodon typus]